MSLNPTTLQTLITLVRQRTNTENSQFVLDTELTSYLNNALCILDGILIEQYNDYKLKHVIIPVTSINQLALPADFLKLRGVDAAFDLTLPDGYLRLDEYDFEKRNSFSFPTLPTVTSPRGMLYRLQDQYIELVPSAIAATWQYQIWYTPDYIPLVNPSDTLQSYMDSQNWYQYAVFAASADVLAKQDLDSSFFLAKCAELKEHIQKLSAPNRNSGEPKAIVDTNRSYGGQFPYGYSW